MNYHYAAMTNNLIEAAKKNSHMKRDAKKN